MNEQQSATSTTTAARWQAVPARERRVLGVMLEKAKTTPDAYPLTLNALCSGCNQKSNRAPLTSYEPDDVQEALDSLRQRGAVAEVVGSGRVPKYRHYFYEWLGVSSVEAAVMAELLLRGAQTEGDLRSRAARMEPIADLAALRTVLDALQSRGLVIPLTPAGRGQIITHNLYEPRELERLRVQHVGGNVAAGTEPEDEDVSSSASARREALAPGVNSNSAHEELSTLRAEVAELRAALRDLSARLSDQAADLQKLKDSFGV